MQVVNFSEVRSEATVKRTLSVGGDEIYYDFVGDILPAPLTDFDAALVASIFMAMGKGEPVHVAGPVSAVLLENVEEFQRAWAMFRPRQFRPVAITADEELPATARPNTAVVAYSGGVDANSSLAFHMEGHAGRRRRDIKGAVLIHGMDVPVEKDFSAFESLARKSLSHYDMPLSVVRTNWRKFNKDWEMVFISGITGCLHQFDVGYGILSSDEDYASIVLPWSSNPVTNHLLTGLRAIQTDGTGFTRTQKVAMLPPELAENLRVCWQDLDPEGELNCGKCEKCIRTKMNFEANGMTPPACLGAKVTARDGLRVLGKNEVQRNYLRDALKFAKKNNVKEDWVRTLPVGLALSSLQYPSAPLPRKVLGRYRKAKRSIASSLLSRK